MLFKDNFFFRLDFKTLCFNSLYLVAHWIFGTYPLQIAIHNLDWLQINQMIQKLGRHVFLEKRFENILSCTWRSQLQTNGWLSVHSDVALFLFYSALSLCCCIVCTTSHSLTNLLALFTSFNYWKYYNFSIYLYSINALHCCSNLHVSI